MIYGDLKLEFGRSNFDAAGIMPPTPLWRLKGDIVHLVRSHTHGFHPADGRVACIPLKGYCSNLNIGRSAESSDDLPRKRATRSATCDPFYSFVRSILRGNETFWWYFRVPCYVKFQQLLLSRYVAIYEYQNDK